MKWNRLKTLAILILLLLDGIFGFLVYSSYKSDNYYDEETIRNVSHILEKSRIYLDGTVLSGKIVSLPVLSGRASEEESETVLALLGDGVPEKTENGYSCKSENGIFILDRNRTLYFCADSYPGVQKEKAMSVENADKLKLSVAEKITAFLKLKDLFGAGKAKGPLFTLSCDSVFFEPASGLYLADLRLIAGGAETDVCFSAVLNENGVLYLSGTMLFSLPERSQTADGASILTCLLKEKAYIDRLTQNGAPSSVRVIEKVSYRYTVYFDLKGNYYLIPVCTIHYHDKSLSSYNVMTGERLEEP